MNIFKIKCKIVDSLNNCKYKIYIYDNNKLIYINCTDESGITYFNPQHNGIYKIIVIPPIILRPIYYSKNIYLENNKLQTITFKFKINQSSPIKIKIIDKNYQKLPIEKGVIKLWLSHMK